MGVVRSVRRTPFRIILLVFLSVIALLGLLGPALGHGREVVLVEVDGIINPVSQRHIGRAVKEGVKRKAELVVIRLDTPGGLLDSTRKIVEELLNAEVPTAVFVAPRGARAASAGTFITAAANFAVMSPGTNIGAASPVGSGGEDLPETLKSKATQDAAALMRSIAQERGRNQEKLEATVLQATSYSAEEAVELKVVDFIAQDLDDLLQQLDGKSAETPLGVRVLDTQDATIREVEQTLVDRFLNFISDPNVSFLLFSLGGLGLVIELFNPGLIFPGVTGAILLILAFLSFGNLPVNWAGVVLLALAVVLFILELQVSGFGILGVGAIVSFLLGGFLLFFQFGTPSPTLPRLGVSWWVLGMTTGILALTGAWLLWTGYQSRKAPATESTSSALVGAAGVATTDLTPRGTVLVGSEIWTAVPEDGKVIKAGDRVRVVKVEGLILTVSKAEETTGQSQGNQTT